MAYHPAGLVDQFDRRKRKLRISVTDRCNFKCSYCMPEHPTWVAKHKLLSFEALYQFCQFMVQQGIEHIRITGGEPLMRQGVVHFIAQLQTLKVQGLKRISMTTNAHYLAKYAVALQHAGLDDLNISLDSLDAEQFYQMTQKHLTPVLEGIEAAVQAGFQIKINTVLLKGINDNQIVPLVRWAQQQRFTLRFIEYMPLDGDQRWSAHEVVTEDEILTTLKQYFEVNRCPEYGSEPARYYQINGQRFGMISTISHGFCGQCDRLRLTAQGELYNCLFAKHGLNLAQDLQQFPINNSVLAEKIYPYVWHKAAGFHAIHAASTPTRKITMHMLGG